MTRLLALLGNPVSHSLSPLLHNAAFGAAELDAVYLALRAGPDDLAGLLRGIARAGGGGNVTLPYKQRAFACADRVTVVAERTQAVNTFWEHDGLVWGDNTDVEGLTSALATLVGREQSWEGARALVLGAGGATRAAVVALESLGFRSLMIQSRRPAQAETLLQAIRPIVSAAVAPWGRPIPEDLDLILNATPLGLSDDDPFPLPLNQIPASAAVMDLVYRPERTPWVRALTRAGYRAMDGGEMLIGQGKAAFERWWGVQPPVGIFESTLAAIRAQHGPG